MLYCHLPVGSSILISILDQMCIKVNLPHYFNIRLNCLQAKSPVTYQFILFYITINILDCIQMFVALTDNEGSVMRTVKDYNNLSVNGIQSD